MEELEKRVRALEELIQQRLKQQDIPQQTIKSHHLDDTVLSSYITSTSLTSTLTSYATLTGSETLTNKTLTAPLFTGNIDGWISLSNTLTYASASSFTIAGVDLTSLFRVGTKLKFTQTTAKYFVVTSSSFSTDTTVNVAVNTDYTVANAAITSPYYSYQDTPQGYPHWFAYTPTPTGYSADPSGVARFNVHNRTCTVAFYISTGGTSNSTSTSMTAPVTSKTVTNMQWFSKGWGVDNGSLVTMTIKILSNSASIVFCNGSTDVAASWTNSGTKYPGGFTLSYEI